MYHYYPNLALCSVESSNHVDFCHVALYFFDGLRRSLLGACQCQHLVNDTHLLYYSGLVLLNKQRAAHWYYCRADFPSYSIDPVRGLHLANVYVATPFFKLLSSETGSFQRCTFSSLEIQSTLESSTEFSRFLGYCNKYFNLSETKSCSQFWRVDSVILRQGNHALFQTLFSNADEILK